MKIIGKLILFVRTKPVSSKDDLQQAITNPMLRNSKFYFLFIFHFQGEMFVGPCRDATRGRRSQRSSTCSFGIIFTLTDSWYKRGERSFINDVTQLGGGGGQAMCDTM